MQINNMLEQYNRNVSQNVSVAAPTPASQQLVEAVGELAVGNVFEGTVNEIKKGQVVLGLSNGETIMARLAGKLDVNVGQSMFFQVKSNNGTQVEIKPYTKGNITNPTLLKALDAAGLPTNGRMVSMVNSMMEEQMPIDKQSLLEMARTVLSQSGVDEKTIVQMSKLDIPITPEMAAQFENYKMDQSAITGQMNQFIEELPQAFNNGTITDAGAWNLNTQILETLLGEAFFETSAQATAEQSATNAVPSEAIAENAELTAASAETADTLPVKNQADYPANTLGRELNAKQLTELGNQLKDFPSLAEDETLFVGGKLNPEMDVKELLQKLTGSLQMEDFQKQNQAKELLSGKPYQALLRNVIEQEWLVRPEELKTGDKIKELYHKLDRQMDQLEQVLKQTGQAESQLGKAVSNVRDNVEFMHQINQNYQYLQIPLKLSGQNAQSDLYVYSNKRNLMEPEGELTAFLHLDLEHLGSTDVSIKMQKRQVHTDFFLADDKSYDLIMEHMDILEAKLEAKGYQCTISVQNQEKKIDFVEDFLKKDQKPSKQVHRYSFDVRA